MSKMHSSASIERIKLSRSFELKLKYGDPIFCKKDANIRKRIRNQQRSFNIPEASFKGFKSQTKPKWKSFWWQFEWSSECGPRLRWPQTITDLSPLTD